MNEKEKKKSFKSNIRLRSTVLVNIRPSPGIHVMSSSMFVCCWFRCSKLELIFIC